MRVRRGLKWNIESEKRGETTTYELNDGVIVEI